MKIKKLLSGAMVAAVMTLTVASTANAQKNLRVYDWAGYDDPAFFEAYMEKHKRKPKFSIFAEEEEARAKMSAGFKIDLAHPCSYNATRWREAGLLQPIDVSKLKHYKDISSRYKKLEGFSHKGKVYIIPYDYGQTAVTYNADKVPARDVKSLQVFVNPKYKGKISMPDNFVDTMQLGLLATGTKDWTVIKSRKDRKYRKALKWLRKAHKNNKFYWTDGPNLAAAMKTREILVAWAWNETPITLQAEGLNIKMTRDTKEGFSAFVCGYVWAKSSTADPKLVYDYLDAVLDPRNAITLVGDFGYGHANAVAMKKLPKSIIDKSVVSNPKKYVSKISFQEPISDKVSKFMNEDFNKIKTGN